MSAGQARAVFAVVRLDHYLRDVADLRDQFTVKKVLPSLEEAEAEAKRLNQVAEAEGKSGVEYVVHHTRLVGDPPGTA